MYMEKNLTLSRGGNAGLCVFFGLAGAAAKPFERLRKYYSDVLGEPVSASRMWRMIHAQAAFLSIVLPFEEPLALRAACCAWFLVAVLKCRE